MRVYYRKNKLPRLESGRLLLRELGLEDISEEYLAWLNDPVTTQYLEVRLNAQTRERVTRYVLEHLENIENSMFFGVYTSLPEQETLIGTIGLNSVSRYHGNAEISFVIGHPQAQGKGFGTEAVHAACAYMFLAENFRRLGSGHYEKNIGSRKILERNGFKREGVRRLCRRTVDGDFTSDITYGLLREEFSPDPSLLGDQGEIVIHANE